MVTGQTMVLHFRLHVVLGPFHDRILRCVKWLILFDAVVFHVSTSAVCFGLFEARHNNGFAQADKYIEKTQMIGIAHIVIPRRSLLTSCRISPFKSFYCHASMSGGCSTFSRRRQSGANGRNESCETCSRSTSPLSSWILRS